MKKFLAILYLIVEVIALVYWFLISSFILDLVITFGTEPDCVLICDYKRAGSPLSALNLIAVHFIFFFIYVVILRFLANAIDATIKFFRTKPLTILNKISLVIMLLIEVAVLFIHMLVIVKIV